MKIQELLEGKFHRGRYDIGQYPTVSDKALDHFYNNVRPNMSRIFDIPERQTLKFNATMALGGTLVPRVANYSGTRKV
ncbi:MAG: hypothetical protein DDT31_00684 [Syntrophomonadaceae bacterium]|nr:hypothetical protein [Bacillota bacterium]